MRRYLIMIFFLFLILGCRIGAPNPVDSVIPSSTITPIPPSATFTLPAPTFTLTPTLVPTLQVTTPAPAASNTPVPLAEPFTTYYHPEDVLYVGDQVSMEVISPDGVDVKDANLSIQVDPPTGPTLGPVNFGAWGIQGRYQATLLWVWDTRNLAPGSHDLTFSVQPQGYSWTEQVTLLPASDMPPDQADAEWATTQTQCCTVFYITNTASERDLPELTALIDEQARISIEEMSADFSQPITITILPRLLGHGGFTSDEISVSYLDRNYAANSWEMVVHHEMIHSIDGRLGGDFRPTIFVEGLAVYMAGGHFKPEPLMPRAAALLDNYLDWYLPLQALADDFYASQHEIGYLEAASLIEYMVNTYGWDAYSAFYRDIHAQNGGSQSDAIDAALQTHFNLSFAQLEQDFIAALRNQADAAAWSDDVRLTVTFFDTMRRYQQLLDPSAYFRTAWLMDNRAMRQRGIVADYLRHPHTPANLALETLFVTTSDQMVIQHFHEADQTLAVINSVLDAIEHGTTDPFSVSPLAADYLSISAYLLQAGYEVQSIELDTDTASVNATNSTGPELIELHLQRTGGQWSLSP